MAEQTAYYSFLGKLRRFPSVYRVLRWIRRSIVQLPANTLRRLPWRGGFGYPRSFFSAAERVRTGLLPGRIVLEEQRCARYPDGSLVRISGLAQDQHQPWPVFWSYHKNAHLTGSSLAVLDCSNLLCAESTFSQQGDMADPSYWHWSSGRADKVFGNVTSIISRWGHLGYWHWLMDSLPRLMFLEEFPRDTRILVPHDLSNWMRWFLDALGLSGRYVPTKATDLWVENYFFASPSSMTGCYNPLAVRFLRNHFLRFRSTDSEFPKRFYIIREGFTRGIANESAVRAFFQKRGWALIAPEKLSIPQQIALFGGAEFVAGIHGSALTNIVWANPGCRVLELTPENFLAGAFEILTDSVGGHHGFVICRADHTHTIHVDLELVAGKLDQMEKM